MWILTEVLKRDSLTNLWKKVARYEVRFQSKHEKKTSVANETVSEEPVLTQKRSGYDSVSSFLAASED